MAEYLEVGKNLPVGMIEGELGYTSRLKMYPCGYNLTVANRALFRYPGWEARTPKKSGRGRSDIPEDVRQRDNQQRARRRAVTSLRDLALSNSWKYFVTLTLDAARVDRYDVAAMTRRLNRWLDNRVRRRGLRYIIVPELHQDGAIHYHGLINDALEAEDSGTISRPGDKSPRRPRSKKQRADWLAAGGHIVYNLPDWEYGYTTAIELYGSRYAAVAYVSKYISKSHARVGGRWYYHSNNLDRPRVLLGYQQIDSAVEDAIADYRAAGMPEADIAAKIGRMYSTIDAIAVTLFCRTVMDDDDNMGGNGND